MSRALAIMAQEKVERISLLPSGYSSIESFFRKLAAHFRCFNSKRDFPTARQGPVSPAKWLGLLICFIAILELENTKDDMIQDTSGRRVLHQSTQRSPSGRTPMVQREVGVKRGGKSHLLWTVNPEDMKTLQRKQVRLKRIELDRKQGVKLHAFVDSHIDELVEKNGAWALALNESQWMDLMYKEKEFIDTVQSTTRNVVLQPQQAADSHNGTQHAEPSVELKYIERALKEKHENGSFFRIQVNQGGRLRAIVIQYLERDPRKISSPIPIHTPDPILLREFPSARNSVLNPIQDLYLKDDSHLYLIKIPVEYDHRRSSSRLKHIPTIKMSPADSIEPQYLRCSPFSIIKCRFGLEFHTRVLFDTLDGKGDNTGRLYPLMPVQYNRSESSLTCPTSRYNGENFVFLRIPKTGSKFVLMHLKATLAGYDSSDDALRPTGSWCISGGGDHALGSVFQSHRSSGGPCYCYC